MPTKSMQTVTTRHVTQRQSFCATRKNMAERALFPKLLARRVVPGAGHFVPHEKPDAVAAALIDAIAGPPA